MIQCLNQILNKDEKVLEILTDNNIIFPPGTVKKVIGWEKEKWKKNFPEYVGLSKEAVNSIQGVRFIKPAKVTFKKV